MTTTLEISVKTSKFDFNFDFDTDQDFEKALIEAVNEEAESQEIEDWEEITDESEVDWEVTDWADVEEYPKLQDIELLKEIADAAPSYDWDVIDAAINCDIQPVDIDECYSGEAESDADFAENLAEELGYIDRKLSWPYTCIDWDMAARDLMYDYTEHNGFYFRVQ